MIIGDPDKQRPGKWSEMYLISKVLFLLTILTVNGLDCIAAMLNVNDAAQRLVQL